MTRVGLARALLVALGAVALVTGGRSLVDGLDGLGPVSGASAVALDNNLRFLSAIWAAVGAGLWACAAAPGRAGTALGALLGLVFAGGVGRLAAFWVHGVPAAPYLGIVASELLAPAVLLLLPRGSFGRSAPSPAARAAPDPSFTDKT